MELGVSFEIGSQADELRSAATRMNCQALIVPMGEESRSLFGSNPTHFSTLRALFFTPLYCSRADTFLGTNVGCFRNLQLRSSKGRETTRWCPLPHHFQERDGPHDVVEPDFITALTITLG